MSGPLSGIKVIDLSRVLAGPWASQLLADYGANVIKIEKPGTGDDTRHWGPPWLMDHAGHATRESAYFLSTNRNKRSITANLAHPAGRALVAELVASADVLLENFRVGTLRQYGLDADSLRTLNPRLIYCSISAYGQKGARSSLPGYDAMIQAEGGLMSITGAPEVEGGEPQKVGVAVADIMTGMYAVTAVLAALEARHRDGNGQHIDVPLYQSQVAWLANQGQNYLMTGKPPVRLGTGHPNIVPYQAFATADGHLMLAVGNDRQFAACMQCMGRDELARDPRFSSNAARVQNRADLVALMCAIMLQRSAAAWLDDFAKAGIPAGRINNLDTVFNDEFSAEVGLVRHLPHALAPHVPAISNPVHFSATPVEYHRAAPILGEQTDEVLAQELGYSPQRIAVLRKEGAI